jgi:hypothetical protein
MKVSSKKEINYITLPDDFEVPETEEGKTFEAVAAIRKDPDGKYCVVSLDGVPLKEDKESADEDAMETESLGMGAKNMMKGES